MPISIEEFYQHNQIDENFDEKRYLETYPETIGFYQPYCQQNNIDDKHRLYFHYVNYNRPPNLNLNYLKVHHGLANRLRTINSFSKFASKHGKQLKIYWDTGPGWSDETFYDLFCGIKDKRLEFIDKKAFHSIPSGVLNISDYIRKQPDGQYLFSCDQSEILERIKHNDFFYFGDSCVEYLFSDYKDDSGDWFYGLLEPVESLMTQIKDIQKLFNTNNTIGLHIRRGDSQFVSFNELYNVSSDEMFCKVIDEEINKDPNVRFYLSTDCRSTHTRFKNWYDKYIIYNENKKFVINHNIFYKKKPYQSDAVIDMWLLSLTRKIIGTNFSSFNQVASKIGNISLEVVGEKEQQQIKNIDRQLKPSVVKIPNELDWQNPAFTEKQAFINHQNNYLCSSNQIYVAYPWSTLIDKMNNLFYKKIDIVDLMRDEGMRDYLIKNIVDKFQIESHKQTYTVCQHALWYKLITLWETLGIDHVYVSHLTNNFPHDSKIKFYPWHLIGCNAENPKRNEELMIKSTKQKKYLCSFIGCHKDNYRSSIRKDLHELYLSNKNNQIYLDIYNEWFFHDIVYKNQIAGIHIDTPSIEQYQFQTIKYNQLLSDSIFSFCPEGYGPNTIRLWESMSIGSIPVLFENDWVRPQIEGMDWDDFSITIRTTEFKDTFDILKCVTLSKIDEFKMNAINAYNKFRLKTCF